MNKRMLQSLILGVSIGMAIGLGVYTFVYAKGASYLTNNPASCANCHIMNEQYDGWLKSSHRAVATCNDCHAREFPRQVRDEGDERLLAFVLFHHWQLPRADPDQERQPGDPVGPVPRRQR
jgi:cytochrome c nitrite reductase small subunit